MRFHYGVAPAGPPAKREMRLCEVIANSFGEPFVLSSNLISRPGTLLREAVGARRARWSGQTGRFHGRMCDPRLDSSGLLWHDAT